MTDLTSIVERLRDPNLNVGPRSSQIMDEAADTIAALLGILKAAIADAEPLACSPWVAEAKAIIKQVEDPREGRTMSGRGAAFLLKLGSGDPLSYATVGGFKINSEVINGDGLEVDRLGGTPWRELLSGGGVRSVAIDAQGIFTGSKGEAEVRRLALAGEIADFELFYERGDKLRGKFLITRLEYLGDVFGERNYLIALESSGEVKAL